MRFQLVAVVFTLIMSLFVTGCCCCGGGAPRTPSSTPVELSQAPLDKANQEEALQEEAMPAPAPEPDLPAKQLAFHEAVEPYYDSYWDAPNELKKSALRTQRKGDIKQALGGSRTVSGWVGTVKTMGTNSEGKAYVTIQLKDSKIRVKTWNNGLSDISDGTLIAQGTSMFNQVAELSKRDEVVFSGKFRSSDMDYAKESSLTESGSMTSPEFIFKFTDIQKK